MRKETIENIKMFLGLMILMTMISMFIGITNRLDVIIAQGEVSVKRDTCICTPIQAEDSVIASVTATVTATYYNAVPGQCDSSPLITADNSHIDLVKLKKKELRWVALSRDLLKRWGGPFDYGDTITIEHKNKDLAGEWVVHDSMNARFTKRMDFLVALGNKFPGKTQNIIIKKET